MYVSGQTLFFLNLCTLTTRSLKSLDRGGIGGVAVSVSHLAVAERCVDRSPNVYIYERESMRLYRILREGEETYSGIGPLRS